MKWLRDSGKNDGGKAYGLSVLIAGGFCVPEGFVAGSEDIKKILAGDTDELKKYLSDFSSSEYFAVRSSAGSEDGEERSFAGIFETKLNVPNVISEITEAVRYVSDSAAGSRAEAYDSDGDHRMNIVIQRMISPVLAGVAFSGVTDEDGSEVIRIEAVEGLAEKLVSGRSSSSVITFPAAQAGNADAVVSIKGRPLDYSRIQMLAGEVKRMSEYFGRDIDTEWCIDRDGKIYFVQARPVTEKLLVSSENADCIVASRGYAEGTVFVIDEKWNEQQTLEQLKMLPENAVLVASATDTRHFPLMKNAAAVITAEGTALSHAAIISRELHIPCITGYKNALSLFRNGGKISVDTSRGCIRYDGDTLYFSKKKRLDLADIYDFDKIAEVKINETVLLFQPSFDGVIMYLPYGTSPEDEEKYEIIARKIFSCQTLRSHILKYEWYFVFKNFKKLPYFNDLCMKLKKYCEDLDADTIERFYQDAVELLKDEVQRKESYNTYDRVLAEEVFLSVYLLTDMIIPNGFAAESAYYNVFSDLTELGITFEDMISGAFTDDCRYSDKFNRIRSFLERISIIRNEISGKLLEIGAIRYDDMATRKARIRSALEYAGCDIPVQGNVSDVFYSKLIISEDIKKLTERYRKLLTEKDQ